MQSEPAHGLNWSPATKELFSNSIARGGKKNFAAVSMRLKKNAGDCQVRILKRFLSDIQISQLIYIFCAPFKQQAYYYSHFKGTSDYRKMKRGAAKKRQMRTRSSVGSDDSTCSDECVRCHDVGELIYCDICMRTFHLYCATPKLSSLCRRAIGIAKTVILQLVRETQ